MMEEIRKKNHQFGIRGILPGQLTCPLKINGWKMYFLLKQSHFRGHVGFQGCKENYMFGFRDPYLKPAPLAHTQPSLSHVFSSNSFCCRLKSSHWTRLCRKVGTSMFGPSPLGSMITSSCLLDLCNFTQSLFATKEAGNAPPPSTLLGVQSHLITFAVGSLKDLAMSLMACFSVAEELMPRATTSLQLANLECGSVVPDVQGAASINVARMCTGYFLKPSISETVIKNSLRTGSSHQRRLEHHFRSPNEQPSKPENDIPFYYLVNSEPYKSLVSLDSCSSPI